MARHAGNREWRLSGILTDKNARPHDPVSAGACGFKFLLQHCIHEGKKRGLRAGYPSWSCHRMAAVFSAFQDCPCYSISWSTASCR